MFVVYLSSTQGSCTHSISSDLFGYELSCHMIKPLKSSYQILWNVNLQNEQETLLLLNTVAFVTSERLAKRGWREWEWKTNRECVVIILNDRIHMIYYMNYIICCCVCCQLLKVMTHYSDKDTCIVYIYNNNFFPDCSKTFFTMHYKISFIVNFLIHFQVFHCVGN